MSSESVLCDATTRRGIPCGNPAVEGSILCSSHDPNYLCGATKVDGERCGMVTGGGRCKYHGGR